MIQQAEPPNNHAHGSQSWFDRIVALAVLIEYRQSDLRGDTSLPVKAFVSEGRLSNQG